MSLNDKKQAKKLKVSLVMPVRNESKNVDMTMQAILSATRIPDEIVIADGMSDDDTREKFLVYREKGVDIKIVDNPARFSGGGRNAGVQASSGDVVILADCGNKVSPDWLMQMVRPFEEQEGVDIVCGVFEPLVSSPFEHCLASIHYYHNYNLKDYSYEKRNDLVPRVLLPGGGTIALAKGVLEAIGGYPEWLHRAQDKVFSRKAYAMGMRVVLNWEAKISHHMRSSIKDVFKLTFEYARGNGRSRYFSKHGVKLFAFYGGVFALLLGGFFSLWLPLLAVILFAYYSFHSGLKKVMRKDSGLKRIEYIWMSFMILWMRDSGILLGHIVGWTEWFLVSKYRELFKRYMRGCDSSRLPIIEL